MLAYGTNVVAGVTPGKGGQTVLGVPVYDTVREAKAATGANCSVIFVPAAYMANGAFEAIDAGIENIVTIAEHVPVHDMMRVWWAAKAKGVRVIGPNSFGRDLARQIQGGLHAHRYSRPQRRIMSRLRPTATNGVMMTNAGIGQSTCVGVAAI